MSSPSSVCRVCKEPSQFLCSKCKDAAYCSVSCQAEEWRGVHRKECFMKTDPFQQYQKQYPDHLMLALHDVSCQPDKFLILQKTAYELRTLEQIEIQLKPFPKFLATVKENHAQQDGNVSVFILKGEPKNNQVEQTSEKGEFYRLPSNKIQNFATVALMRAHLI